MHPLIPSTLIMLSLFLPGCAMQPATSPDSPYFEPPPGTLLHLSRPVTIPAGHARVYLQQDRSGTYNQIDAYEAFCDLELVTVSESARELQPLTMVLTRVRHRLTDFDLAGGPGLRLAGWFGFEQNGQELTYVTVYELTAEENPDIMRLNCKETFDAGDPRGGYPSFAQIRAVVNPWLVFELPGNATTGHGKHGKQAL